MTKRTLHLSVKEQWFNLMITGLKISEIRKPSDWIKSRLKGKEYGYVKIVNGYGNDRPYAIFELDQVEIRKGNALAVYKDVNGHEVTYPVNDGDYIIYLGKRLVTGNLTKYQEQMVKDFPMIEFE